MEFFNDSKAKKKYIVFVPYKFIKYEIIFKKNAILNCNKSNN
jgi:hypothetical protein